MNPTIELLKRLRTETGAAVMACRYALEQGNYDYESALAYLRKKAALKAEQQAGRATNHGRIELYSHGEGRIGVMVEIHTETDFAARSEAFRSFGREIALHIAAAAPRYVLDEDIPQAALDEMAAEAAAQARRAGKPERIIDRIVPGVLEKHKNRHVLLRQTYIRDETLTVGELLSQTAAQIGENVVIHRFARWEIDPEADVD